MAVVLALALAAATVALLVARPGDGPLPGRLVDGSPALGEPARLPRGVRGVVRVGRAQDVGADLLESCLRLLGVEALPGRTLVVERVGVDGRSLTFRDPAAPRMYGCDASADAAEPVGRWCGASVGTLAGGRLLDPRLDLANCRDASGRPVAFAWIELPRAAAWLAVEREGWREYYRAGGGLPIRVASPDAVDGPSSAVFSVTVRGPRDEVEQRTVRAVVAG